MHKWIESIKNPLIKEWASLQEKSRNRKKSRAFILEGKREFQLAISGGYKPLEVLICEDIISEEDKSEFSKYNPIFCSKEVYQKLAYRGTTEGILAKMETKDHSLNKLRLSKNPIVLIAESTEKPGNIGALLRTADAANIDAVIIANPKTDLYNPNVIRSSVGCTFTTQISTGTSEEVIRFLKEKKIQVYAAALKENAENYYDMDFKKPSAIAVGTEATGLSSHFLNNADHTIIIPMEGKIDSMNVSVSASILIFEAKRQRL